MADFFTYAIYDQGVGLNMSGIPSLDAARAIAIDFYRQPAEWDSFLDEMIPTQEVVFGFEDDHLMFGHSADRFFGSIAIERRCGCCGHVIDRRTVNRTDNTDITKEDGIA